MARVFKLGDNVSTDEILPGRYAYTLYDRSEMARHALEDLDPSFARRVRPGDVVVAGRNFGCGAAREEAAACLKEAGVAAIVAVSFARLFWRNALTVGLPPLVCPAAAAVLVEGDELSLDLGRGLLVTERGQFSAEPLAEPLRELLAAGGALPLAKKKLASGR
jgi:3-isopropylmalate/(R)-2-methylmalate dehydratase small subunit